MAIPLILGSLLEPLAGIVDTAFVGHLGPKNLAALGVGVSVFNSFFWVFNFLIHIPMESVARGQVLGREALVAQAKIGLISALAVGLISFFILYMLAGPILSFAGAQSETIGLSREYYLVRVFGQPVVLVYFCLLSILRGTGRVKVSLIPVACSVLLNIVLTYIFIYHLELGLKGAALGTVTSYIVGLGITILLLYREFGISLFYFKDLPGLEGFSNFSKKSGFLFVRSFCLTGIFFISAKVSAEISVYSISSYQIALQFWLFSSYFLDGLAMVGNMEAAKLSAEGNSKRFLDFCGKLFNLSFGIGFIFTATYFIFSDQLFSLFTTNKKILESLEVIWPIVLGGQIINALAFSIDGIYFGLGKHSRLAKMMVINLIVVFLPCAYLSISKGSLRILMLGLLFTSIFRWFYLKRNISDDFHDHRL